MNNLFILHTQYNIILSIALIENKHLLDNNYLILDLEFDLNADLYNNLLKYFKKIIVFKKNDKKNTRFGREIILLKKIIKSNDFRKINFTNVYMSQEREFEQLFISRSKIKCNVGHVEEDIYFSYSEFRNIKNNYYENRISFKRKMINIMMNIVYGKHKIFSYPNYYGESSLYNQILCLYPSLVRDEIKNKYIIHISEKDLVTAVYNLYQSNIDYNLFYQKGFIVFLNLIERYENVEEVLETLKEISDIARIKGYDLLIKNHPKESRDLSKEFLNIKFISSNIPSEKVLIDFIGKNYIIIGNTSTALQVASYLKFYTISIKNDVNMYRDNIYNKMGIILLDRFSELISILGNN